MTKKEEIPPTAVVCPDCGNFCYVDPLHPHRLVCVNCGSEPELEGVELPDRVEGATHG